MGVVFRFHSEKATCSCVQNGPELKLAKLESFTTEMAGRKVKEREKGVFLQALERESVMNRFLRPEALCSGALRQHVVVIDFFLIFFINMNQTRLTCVWQRMC